MNLSEFLEWLFSPDADEAELTPAEKFSREVEKHHVAQTLKAKVKEADGGRQRIYVKRIPTSLCSKDQSDCDGTCGQAAHQGLLK